MSLNTKAAKYNETAEILTNDEEDNDKKDM